MARLHQLRIQFDNNKSIYEPGEIIKGRVLFILKNDTPIKSVKVIFCGVSHVHWESKNKVKKRTLEANEILENENTSDGHITVKVTHNSKEEWFNSSLLLMNNPIPQKLKKGDHSYKFQFVIPNDIPGSFTHSLGSITYSIDAIVDQSNDVQKITQIVSINQYLDLNIDPSLRLATGNTAKKQFCCDILRCRNEPVLANFSIDKSGFVPGQAINFNVIIDNKSRTKISIIKVYLVRDLKFRTPSELKTTREEIKHVDIPNPVEPYTAERWHNQSLTVPNECKVSEEISKIIESNYKLVLKFGAGGLSLLCNCEIPIVIGTIPFFDSNEEFEIHNEINPSHDNLISFDNPPTYEEALRSAPSPSAPYAD